MVRAGILVTGSELLTGRVTDQNGPWLAERLGALGVDVAEVLVVGDRRDDLAGGLRFLADARLDLIVTSGGLGPTADDVTAEVVADFAGVPLVVDAAVEARIAEILRRWAARHGFAGDALTAANRKQATVPVGATVLDPVGTAPGLVVAAPGGPLVVVLPGPPRELRGMWPAALDTAPVRELLAGAPAFTGVHLRMFGLPESEIAQTLREVGADVDLSGLDITTCLRRSELEVDLRYRSVDARAAAEKLVAEIERRHGRYLVSTDGSTTDELVARLLTGHWIGLGESCTGGLLAGRLTDRAGASAYLAGGVVAYSNQAKTALLGVPAELIETHGAVSPEVARAMADGARTAFGADVGVGITGVAGPGGGTETKPVGYVCLCVTTATGQLRAADPVLPGNRTDIRERATDTAMHLIRRTLT
ncbi:competence/damage-inducible protein A [Pseudonocardia acaciae]|uniref:competence/damage-inducible protein A n=1 Tax=Pseudonocardia acaciae TaxID=551276 RepID=UPI0005620C7C|nr:competence/damage-inducible protein A [Pseudonocardia acaciae]